MSYEGDKRRKADRKSKRKLEDGDCSGSRRAVAGKGVVEIDEMWRVGGRN